MRHFLRMRDLRAREIRRLFARAAAAQAPSARGAAGGLARRQDGGAPDGEGQHPDPAVVRRRCIPARRTRHRAERGTSQLARGEPLSDTARVVSGYADAVVMRTTADARLEEFVRWSSVPVINGLTDGGHPVQVLTDLFTVEEAIGAVAGRAHRLRRRRVGEHGPLVPRGRAALFDFTLQLAAPPEFRPPPAEARGRRAAPGGHRAIRGRRWPAPTWW